ncbi:MAG: pyruvate, phosphate dikinase, partial [Thaumarchaeota archaeon]|nr:pyruvate, phosphate dikinase [Nitrososphaerota archaeon]
SFSREDAEGKFLPEYIEKEVLERNPFQTVDVNGVGSLVKIAITNGKSVKPGIEIGVCGEHGGDPNSIKFFHNSGVSYVSASPHRIPIAIVAAAQARIQQNSTPSKKKAPRKVAKGKKAKKKSRR